jgi:hypothetical protein
MTIHFINFLSSLNNAKNDVILDEAIHHELQSILDSDTIDPRDKLDAISTHVRKLKIENHNTGLVGDIPKKGSSRAVFFPKEGKKINLDGIHAKIGTAIKIAHQGEIEKQIPQEGPMLGQMQNEAEADPLMAHHHGIIRKNQDGSWHTNHDGVIPPLFSAHPDHHHIEVARVSPFNPGKFKEATTTPSFPNGITHQEFHDTVQHVWAKAHGMSGYHYSDTDHKHMDDVLVHHPFVKNVVNFSADTNTHPADFVEDNVGTWTHPHTGKLHPVLLDYGFRGPIVKAYQDMYSKYQKAQPTHEN